MCSHITLHSHRHIIVRTISWAHRHSQIQSSMVNWLSTKMWCVISAQNFKCLKKLRQFLKLFHYGVGYIKLIFTAKINKQKTYEKQAIKRWKSASSRLFKWTAEFCCSAKEKSLLTPLCVPIKTTCSSLFRVPLL